MSTQNPMLQLPAQVPDLTSAFSVPANDPLLPQGMNSGLANLQQAFGKTLGQGSFAGRHPILSALLGAGGGALLGGIAGGMDSDVGAGRGALAGALTGGISTPLLERQRKNQLANTYMSLVPKIAEQQKTLDEMRKNRAGGLMSKQLMESQGIDAGFMATEDGGILPVSDAMAQIPLNYLEGTALSEQAGDLMGGKDFRQGASIGQEILGGQAPVPAAQATPQASILPNQPIMEVDPTVSQQPTAASPLVGNAMMQAPPVIGSRQLMPIGREAATKLMETQSGQQETGIQEAIKGLGVKSLAELRGAQMDEILKLLPANERLLLMRAYQSEQSGNLAKRTNPNLRSGRPVDPNEGPLKLINAIRQLGLSQATATKGGLDQNTRLGLQDELANRLETQYGITLPETVETPQESGGFDISGFVNSLKTPKPRR